MSALYGALYSDLRAVRYREEPADVGTKGTLNEPSGVGHEGAPDSGKVKGRCVLVSSR